MGCGHPWVGTGDAHTYDMLMPTLASYMTCKPMTIGPKAPLIEAHRLMREHSIRHLPVVDRGRVVGVVTMHDLHLLETFPGIDINEVEVDVAMSTDIYTAAMDDDLATVAEHMADRKISCAVVTRDHLVAGIFTAIDALFVLASVLRRQSA